MLLHSSRRNFIVGTTLLAAMPQIALGQDKKFVYENWTQAELDNQIDQTSYIGNVTEIEKEYVSNSSAVRAMYPPKTFNYGVGSDENLDVFAPQMAKAAPIMIFIHGGAWESGNKNYYDGPAPTFINANAIYIPINFTNTPPNTVPGMIDQCRKAVAWVYKNAAMFGGSSENIYVSGHSSGGHIANVMLSTQWTDFGMPADILKGGLIMSGWSDLYPISLSSRQSYLKFDKRAIAEYSPINRLSQVRVPIIISWGALESPYMQRQSAEWAQKLQSVGKLAGTYKVPGKTHYEMPNQLNSHDTEISKAILALMNIV